MLTPGRPDDFAGTMRAEEPVRGEGVPVIELCINNAREWPSTESYHKLIYYDRVDKGVHFAAWEQPALFAEEI